MAYRHRVFPTIDAAASAAKAAAPISNVFFCIHSLVKEKVWNPVKLDYKTDTPGAWEIRTQSNMLQARAFFFDLDVGTSTARTPKYDNQRDALAGLMQFCKDAKLPKPLVTSSGGGLHVYWTLSEAIPSADWRFHAAKLKALALHHGLRIDRMRTTDVSSVLRVAGTFNLKDPNNPRPVEILIQNKPVGTGAFVKLLDDALIRASVVVTPNPVYQSPRDENGFEHQASIAYDGPRPRMKAVMLACEQMRSLYQERETIDNTAWYYGLTVARCTREGIDGARKFSAAHRADRVETRIAGLEAIKAGPSKCTTIADKCGEDICRRCTYAGKVNNPLAAARFKDEAPAPKVLELVGHTMQETDVPDAPPPYKRLADGGISARVTAADGETDSEEIIYENDLFPIRRMVNEVSAIEQQLWRVVLPRSGTKDFVLDADALYDRKKCISALANQGIYPDGNNVQRLQDYMVSYISHIQKLCDAEPQYNHLGWTDDKAAFILPDKILLSDGSARTASLSMGAKRASAQVHKLGTLERQVELMGFYDRPEYVPHQYFILGGLAAAIYYMTGQHGVIVNATGEAGASKSTSLYTAASFWGSPELYPINGTNDGATVRARNERVSTLANLPVCVDEITLMPPKDAKDLAMSISQPGHRLRLDTSGVERNALGSYKATVMMATANSSLHTMLSSENSAGTAGSMRVFEITFKPGTAHRKHEADAYLRELKQNYGHIGEAFLYHVMRNRDAIEKRIHAKQREIDEAAHIRSAERFWSADAAAHIVAGEIAYEHGLLPFDVAAIQRWALEKQIPQMRGIVRDEYATPLGVLSEYLESIQGNMVVTARMSGASQMTTGVNVLMKPHGQLLAHYDMTDRTMWVLKKGFKDYCLRAGANYLKILSDLGTPKADGQGAVSKIISNANIRKVLGAGTDQAKAQTWCFMVDMDHPEISGAVDLNVIVNPSPAATAPAGQLKVV